MTEHFDRNAASGARRPPMRPVRDDVASKIHAQLGGSSSETLMVRFGISYNTWRKVRCGEPIRTSVAERLERRMAARSNAEEG